MTREGQLIFFAQFLRVGGRWERLASNCPLTYEGNRGSRVVDVLGTATLSVLCGHYFRHWLGGKWLEMLPPEAESLLSG